MNDTPNAPDTDDDELLNTIRMMVQEEAAREPPVRPAYFPAQEAASETPAPPPQTAQPQGSGPLVLGAMARVDGPTRAAEPPRGPAAPIYDEEALRRIVSELVRDEFDQIMGEALDHRIRQLARRELSTLLARARGENG
ncbi:hypothetical protein HMH01_13000 [Halovulum dunhuangense]|uniref:Uncharacterized protein n=1 Tax=Halovulum dunhuangense TaxID=1505036 RepID=A0A849L4S3_9RHOB|nr:hypothetical protein [Halovulum dunhuangense]NNU81356.1 hypothetical protein [Halovulum dunhuangense]